MEVRAMPWSDKSVMEKKLDFIRDYQAGIYTIAELSRRYSISRKTAYKYIARFKKAGAKGLEELSRAPHRRPRSTSSETVNEIIDMKLRFMPWGPKKIIAKLINDHPDKTYPSPSTAQHWLSYYGLVDSKKRTPKVPPYTEPFSECNASNDVWSIDFKGQFRMGNNQYCYPLTLEDNYSRFLLLCIGLAGTRYEDTRKWLQWAFEEYGLPRAIRSDNGTPFVAPGQTGLSQLSIWLIQLGIVQERTDLGHPEQNGRLERFHRTLKDHIRTHPQEDLVSQQELFSMFKYEYNHLRPHESLGFKTPSEFFRHSARPYPARIDPPEYGPEMDVRKVLNSGEISLDWSSYYVCQLLRGEYVGLKYTDSGQVEIYYYDRHILTLDKQQGRIHSRQRRLHRASCLKKQIKYQPWKKELCEGGVAPFSLRFEDATPPSRKKRACQRWKHVK